MHGISGCDSVSSFYPYWKDNKIPKIKKQTRQTDRYDRIRWISLTLLSAVTSIQYVSYFYDGNKSGLSVNELRRRML